jgi:hypothetical protein
MHVKAIPSLSVGSLFLTFSSETGATVKLVVAFPAEGSGIGSPLITTPFWVDPSKPTRFDVTRGLSKLANRARDGSGEVRVVLSIGSEESQSGRYRIAWEDGAFTKFESV